MWIRGGVMLAEKNAVHSHYWFSNLKVWIPIVSDQTETPLLR
jgi:hypothetical protein